MKHARVLLCAALLALLPGCLLTNVTTPLDTDVAATQLGARSGTSSYTSLLWLFAWGDAGTHAAARAGGISVVRHMDQHTFMVLLGLYTKNTTIVYGD